MRVDVAKSSSGLSSKRIILSPFTKEFRGEGHSYESLTFSGVAKAAKNLNFRPGWLLKMPGRGNFSRLGVCFECCPRIFLPTLVLKQSIKTSKLFVG